MLDEYLHGDVLGEDDEEGDLHGDEEQLREASDQAELSAAPDWDRAVSLVLLSWKSGRVKMSLSLFSRCM